jgi:hypothetical protein
VLFEIYFTTGSVYTNEASEPLEAAILACANRIVYGYPFKVDSIRNKETGQLYKIEQAIKEVGNE